MQRAVERAAPSFYAAAIATAPARAARDTGEEVGDGALHVDSMHAQIEEALATL
jgi:hypothetical protein